MSRIGFAYIGRAGSVLVTVSLSVERYLSIRSPNTDNWIKKLLIPLPIVFAITHSLPKFFEFERCYEVSNSSDQITLRSPITTDELSSMPFTLNIKHPYENQINSENASMPIFPVQDILDKLLEKRKNSSRIESAKLKIIDCKNKPYVITELRKNHWYIILYVFGSEVIFVEMLPWITVIVLNLLTWKGITVFQRNRKRLIRNMSSGKKLQH